MTKKEFENYKWNKNTKIKAWNLTYITNWMKVLSVNFNTGIISFLIVDNVGRYEWFTYYEFIDDIKD